MGALLPFRHCAASAAVSVGLCNRCVPGPTNALRRRQLSRCIVGAGCRPERWVKARAKPDPAEIPQGRERGFDARSGGRRLDLRGDGTGDPRSAADGGDRGRRGAPPAGRSAGAAGTLDGQWSNSATYGIALLEAVQLSANSGMAGRPRWLVVTGLVRTPSWPPRRPRRQPRRGQDQR
jgi:hypothetical protein